MKTRLIAGLLLALAAFGQGQKVKEKKVPKPSSLNFFSKDQDVQMGKEYAQQIEQQFVVVSNRELTDYINRVGQRLLNQGGLGKDHPYPYYFKVVQEPSINAFALPGGPMYVHTGLIKAADNEGQLAGVLAHELSHVALRHGTNQASKAQMIQLPAMLAGMMAGSSITGQLAQLGIGLGANSVLLKFSRGAESDADLLGAHVMSRAGYNPIEMARFFEKLEAEAGKGGNSRISAFFSSHPNPGNRVKAVEEQLPFMAKSDYSAREGDLGRMKQTVDQLPPLKEKKTAPQQAGGQGSPAPAKIAKPASVGVSQQFKTYEGRSFSISHPDNWVVQAGQTSMTIGPKEGLVDGQIGYGLLISGGQAPGGKVNLEQNTRDLVQAMSQQNQGMRIEAQPVSATIGGSPALVTRLSSESPYAGVRETDVLITVDRGATLYYMIFIAPEGEFQRFEPVFQQMSKSLRFGR